MKVYVFFFLLAISLASCKSTSQISKSPESLYSFDIEQKLESMGIPLRSFPLPDGVNIVRAVRSGNLLFLSGKGPTKADGSNITGKVGEDLSMEEGAAAARLVAINQLSILKEQIGDLNKVVQIVKVFGMVNTTPEFSQHSQVINGYSDLMIEVFGERGKHARAAVGMVSLPGNIAVEVDMIVEIRD